MITQLVAGMLLVCLGLLLGAGWTVQAVQPKLRRQAAERRKLNEEWSAVRAARRQQTECPRCATRMTGRDRYYTKTIEEQLPDDE